MAVWDIPAPSHIFILMVQNKLNIKDFLVFSFIQNACRYREEDPWMVGWGTNIPSETLAQRLMSTKEEVEECIDRLEEHEMLIVYHTKNRKTGEDDVLYRPYWEGNIDAIEESIEWMREIKKTDKEEEWPEEECEDEDEEENIHQPLIRMVQLFLNKDNVDEFHKMVKICESKLGTKNITDTIFTALKKLTQ